MDRRALLSLALVAPVAAHAQSRPVRLIVPTTPGGAIDNIGRIYAQRLGARLNQTWVIENRAGANNTLGAGEAARAPNDGSAFMTNADIHLMARHTVRNLPYDPVTDFAPVGRMATAPMMIVGHPTASRANTLAELADAMRRDPARYAFGTSSAGSMSHLAAEGFKRRVGAADILIANYRGTAPALNDVVGGSVPLMVAPLLSAQPLVAGGRLRAFAVTSPTRSAAAPDVPTVDEAGLPGLHYTLWYAMWAPRGVPAPLAEAVSGHVREIGQEPDVARRLAEMGVDPFVTDTPATFAAFIAEEERRNAVTAREAGIQPE